MAAIEDRTMAKIERTMATILTQSERRVSTIQDQTKAAIDRIMAAKGESIVTVRHVRRVECDECERVKCCVYV